MSPRCVLFLRLWRLCKRSRPVGIQECARWYDISIKQQRREQSGLELDQHLMVAMIVYVPRRMRIAAFAEINLTRVQCQPRGPGRPCHFKRGAFNRVKKIIVIVLMRFHAFPRPQRELPDAHAIIFEYQPGSDLCHNKFPPLRCKRMTLSLSQTVHWLAMRSAYTGITDHTIAAS